MESEADRIVAEILRADESFLIEIGRSTLLFSRVEECLARDALTLGQISEDKELREAAVPATVARLRMLEKRDFLKRVVAEIGRYYDVDHSRVREILDEFGNINRHRKFVVHGWIRWSFADKKPMFVGSHGHSEPAWPDDVLDLNLKILNWLQRYSAGQAALHARCSGRLRRIRRPAVAA